MSDTPNRPPETPPPSYGTTAIQIHTIPEDARCAACELRILQGQTTVETNTGDLLHMYCWERNH